MKMSTKKGRTGRDKFVYLLTEGEALAGVADSIVKGKFYYVTAKAEAASVLPVDVGDPFLCSKDATLADGDECVPLSKELLGFVRDSGLDASKGVQDVTTDENDEADYTSDNLVSKTGSFGGYDKKGTSSETAAQKLFKQFERLGVATAGVAEAADTVSISEIEHGDILLMVDYDARHHNEGDIVDIDIFPALLTSMSKSSNTGSVNPLTFNYTRKAVSETGMKPLHYIGPWRAEAAS